MSNKPFWTVIENQRHANGAFAMLYNHYTKEADAISKYHEMCLSAAQSDLPYHAVHVLSDEGNMVRQEIYRRGEIN